MLSRFDLIFLILDNADKDADARLASHMVSLYYADAQLEDRSASYLVWDCCLASMLVRFFSPLTEHRQSLQDRSTLTQYISYARKHVNPRLTEDVRHLLLFFSW